MSNVTCPMSASEPSGVQLTLSYYNMLGKVNGQRRQADIGHWTRDIGRL